MVFNTLNSVRALAVKLTLELSTSFLQGYCNYSCTVNFATFAKLRPTVYTTSKDLQSSACTNPMLTLIIIMVCALGFSFSKVGNIRIVITIACSCGCKLSAEDRYKIDKTAMGEVMSRGKEKEGHSAEMAEAEAKDVSELEEQGEEEEEEGEEMEEGGLEFGLGGLSLAEEKELGAELEEILKSCSRVQSKPKLVPVKTSESGT